MVVKGSAPASRAAKYFLRELKQALPTEYLELERGRGEPNELALLLESTITKAYVTGYMRGSGWISREELMNVGLYLGETLAEAIRSNISGVEPKGKAFAACLARIQRAGAVDAGTTAKEDQRIVGCRQGYPKNYIDEPTA
jgi:hypothetical protein